VLNLFPGYDKPGGVLLVDFYRPPASFDTCGLGWRNWSGTQGHRLLATSGLLLFALSFAFIA
jgi:hypothetical protein